MCVIIGFKARFATLAYVVGSLAGLNFQYSFGKIDHYILPYVLLVCLSFSGWGSGLAVRPDKAPSKEATARSLSLAAALICFAFFTAGFEKALNWIDFNPDTSGVAAWLYKGVYRLGRTYLLAPFFGAIPFRYLEVFDYSAVVFELSAFLFLLRSRKAWHIWLLIACLFHLLNTLLLNIAFISNVAVYLAFIDYSGMYETIKEAGQKRWFRVATFFMLAVFSLLRLRVIFAYQSETTLFIRDSALEPILYVGGVLWISAIVILINSLLKSVPKRTNGIKRFLSTQA